MLRVTSRLAGCIGRSNLINTGRKPLSEVTEASKNSTIVVALESLIPERTSASGDVTYQKLLFRDKAGMEIPATLFDADVELFSDVFHPGKVYEITNAVIAPVREDVRRGTQNFQMTIKATTKVVELSHSNIDNHSYIVPLDSSIEYLGNQGRIDIIGLAVHVTAPRKVRPKSRNMEFDARDIYLLDQSMKPTTLTVWQAFVSNEAQTISDIVASRPTVLATQVSSSKFRGGRWNATFFSTVRLDYDGPEAVALRQWETENAEEIARIAEHLHESVGENSRIVLPIAALGFEEDGAIVWIKGHITNVNNPERCVYSSCSICNSGTETPIGDKFPCSQTATPHIGTSVYRCNLQIRFDDESSAIKLTLFDVLAEKVLKRTATEIACLSPEERLSLVSDFVDSARGQLFTIELLAKRFGSSKKQLRFTARHVEAVAE